MNNLRPLGTSDLQVTPIGLGTWAIGGGDWKFAWGPQDDDTSVATIRAAYDGGINWLDTAPVYGLGHSEIVVGRALKEMGGQRPIVATKCGRVWPEGDRSQVNRCLTRDSIKRECEQSLQRLGVDVIDLYQIHWPQPDEEIEEGWTAVAELQTEGKIRHAGVSNFSIEQMQRAATIAPIISLQPQYNLIQRQAEADTLPYCRENTIGVVGYSTLAKGLLTGKVTPEWVAGLPDDDHRKNDPMYAARTPRSAGPGHHRLRRTRRRQATVARPARRRLELPPARPHQRHLRRPPARPDPAHGRGDGGRTQPRRARPAGRAFPRVRESVPIGHRVPLILTPPTRATGGLSASDPVDRIRERPAFDTG